MISSDNITPYLSKASDSSRIRITGARPTVYWMSGLSGAGKSTIAALFEKKMLESGRAAFMLDGDTVRTGLCAGLGFSPEDRHENLRRIAHLAAIMASSGQTVVVCTISPDKESRDNARLIISEKATFKEVYVKASVETCAGRDPKGLYKKAMAGEIKNFTGVSAPYEIPENPELTLDTSSLSPEESAEILYNDAVNEINRPGFTLREMIKAGLKASEKIMEIYDKGFEVTIKDDKSPLTTADTASNEVLTTHFREVFPEYSILSEEETDNTSRLSNNAGVFIIDPIDGTKEFISRNGEFCVSIGFASHNRVIGGVITVPAKGVLYYAWEGLGSYKMSFSDFNEISFAPGDGNRLHVSDRCDKVVITASRSHPDAQTAQILEKYADRILDTFTAGSCLKGCTIAEGIADVHYRFGAFMKEWDTAAMEIICKEAGASFTDLDGQPLVANRADPVNRNGFIILNRPESAFDLTGI